MTCNTCFFCEYFNHLDPDNDYCSLHDSIVFFDSFCPNFTVKGGDTFDRD